MQYYIGQTFIGYPPPEAIAWVNSHNCKLERNGDIYTIVENAKPIPTKADLTAFVSAAADKVAYGGITVVADGEKYLFKTDTDNIARCGAVMPAYDAMADDQVIPWEVWQGDVPTMLSVNAEQFKACYAFGAKMTIEVETVKGAINAEVQKLTDEQLANEEYITAFKENAVMQLNAVNTIFELTMG